MLIKPTARAQEVQIDEREDTGSPHKQFSIASYSLSGSTYGESSGLNSEHGGKLPLVSLYATSDLPHRTLRTRAVVPAPTKLPTGSRDHSELSMATVKLNNERRAFGAKEYETFKQRYSQPKKATKPSLLTKLTATRQELQACIPYIFHSTIEGKQQTQELKNETSRWTQEFSRFVNDDKATPQDRDECILTLLGRLNEAIDASNPRMRQLFYETSGSMGFADALDHVKTVSKAVRVQKEIEEFEDVKDEWEERRRSP